MKQTIKDMKNYIVLVLIAIIAYWSLFNIDKFIDLFKTMYTVFEPFIIGGIIAFILNIPATKIENYLKKHSKKITNKSLIRIISIVLSLVILLLIIIFIAFLLIPELIENIELLMNNIPGLIDKIEVFIIDLLDKYPDIQKEIQEMFSESGNVSNIISNILNYIVNGAVGFISNLVSSFILIFTAIIFSIYILTQKEYLVRSTKKVIYAITSKETAKKIINIGTLTNKTFTKFISGQCVDAVILGCLMFVAFTIFRFPYALIISILTGITALIPIFGALIAMIIGAVLIAINSLTQTLVFIIVFLIIQQIEGNLIYPKVVGKSVGLSPMWTLLAITVGGNMFGIPGMLLGLPLASVVYAILKNLINDKLSKKQIDIA